MKRFRRITALALTLVVIAMLGISASAASETINGDFGAFTHFEWTLTRNAARGEARFRDNGGDIHLQEQKIVIEGIRVNENTYEREEYEVNVDLDDPDIVAEASAFSPWYLLNATFNYDATYTANGVPCYYYSGPKVLHN